MDSSSLQLPYKRLVNISRSLCKLLSTTKHKKFKRTSIPKVIQYGKAMSISSSQETVTGDTQHTEVRVTDTT